MGEDSQALWNTERRGRCEGCGNYDLFNVKTIAGEMRTSGVLSLFRLAERRRR